MALTWSDPTDHRQAQLGVCLPFPGFEILDFRVAPQLAHTLGTVSLNQENKH